MATKKKTSTKKTTTKKTTTSKKRTRSKKTASKTKKKISALDTAAKLLTEVGEPMRARELVARIASEGYWSSPSGQTPHATLYSAILREIQKKGKDARFKKTDRGLFLANS